MADGCSQAASDRVSAFLAKANLGLAPPPRLQTLSPPRRPSLNPVHNADATSLLCLHRKAQNDATRNVRSVHVLSLKRRQRGPDHSDRVFTDDEVAAVVDNLLDAHPLGPVAVARAVFSHARVSGLDELWACRHGPGQQTGSPWLNKVTSRAALDYMQWMCEMGMTHGALSEAFRIAFQQGCLGAMGLLLSYGADVSRCKSALPQCIQAGDEGLVKLLLAAPHAMSDDFWRTSLSPCEAIAPAIFAQCLAHRPTVADEHMLMRALSAQNLQTTAILLAYAAHKDLARYNHEAACQKVCTMDAAGRHVFLDLLNEAGFLHDNSVLREELRQDVKDREMQLVHMLIEAGVSPDSGLKNAFQLAVTNMDLQMVDALCAGTLKNAAAALDWIPSHAPERDTVALLKKMETRNLVGEPLDRRLACAVQCKYAFEATELIHLGASVAYQEGLALRTAIRNRDFAMFDVLLQATCAPKTLSRLVPEILSLHPEQRRLEVMEKVLSRDALPEALGRPLEMLLAELAETGEADLACIRLLLKYGASPDVSDGDSTNSVLVAARKGHRVALNALCDKTVRPEILSRAVLIAFRQYSDESIPTYDHNTALEIMRFLLDKGANGTPIDQALQLAVIRQSDQSIVRLLLASGADANHTKGDAFARALRSKCLDILRILCERCPPNRASTESLIPLAIDPRYHDPAMLDLILTHTRQKSAALGTVTAEMLRTNPNMAKILHCLLHHGLEVNSGECRWLRLAVSAEDLQLLGNLLAKGPNSNSLRLAFEASTGIKVKKTRLNVMKLLLQKAAGAEIGQTMCLQEQTQAAIRDDYEGLQLVLRHGAKVDHQTGIAVQTAAAAGHVKVLRLLLMCRPTLETVKHGCIACLERNSIPQAHRHAVYEALLDASAGADGSYLSRLLDTSVQSKPTEVLFPRLLLDRGARMDAATIRTALKAAGDDLLRLITERAGGPSLFRMASSTKMPAQRRLWLFKNLLGQGVGQADKSRALLHSLSPDRIGDLSIVELLLKHGADVSVQRGEAFRLAAQAQSVAAIRLLSKCVQRRELANIAFSYASTATFADPHMRFEIYQCLLDKSLVSKWHCQTALQDCLSQHGADLNTVRLLLEKGAAPNATSLISACRISTTDPFREFCKHLKLEFVFETLISGLENEADAARWLKLCIDQQPSSAKITNPDLLAECIRRYPHGDAVLTLILERGAALPSTVSYSICPGWAGESCSGLIWALMTTTPKLPSKTIVKLMSAASIDIDYETPITHVTAPLACLLDSSRTPVLEALLRMRPDLAVNHQVSASALASLGAHPSPVSQQIIDDLGTPSLRMASLHLGNIEAFKLLDDGNPFDEALLHLVAMLALPKFVQEFLKSHDPNLILDGWGNYTPLAVVIEVDATRGPPWAKVANAEGSFDERRKETIRHLARKSEFTWRFRKKTYVHLALHVDAETTTTLCDALDIGNWPDKFQKLVYEDKERRQYTPCEYVREVVSVEKPDPKEQQRLLRALSRANLLTDDERWYCGR